MSFSFDFIARNKQDALELLEKQHAPYAVKQIVESAIRGVRGADAIKVSAVGHLCQSDTYYQLSSAHISIEPIVFAKLSRDFCSGTPNDAAGHGVAGHGVAGAISVAGAPFVFNGAAK